MTAFSKRFSVRTRDNTCAETKRILPFNSGDPSLDFRDRNGVLTAFPGANAVPDLPESKFAF